MKTKPEILFAAELWDKEDTEVMPNTSFTPVVLFADHCAEVEKLKAELAQKEQLRANAVARCEELIKELHQTARAHEIITTGRWDTLPKAL